MASSAITMSITAMDVIVPVFMCVTILMSLRAVVVHMHRTTAHAVSLEHSVVELVSDVGENTTECKTKRNCSQETVSVSDPEVIEQVLVKKSFLFPLACETPANARRDRILKRNALKALSGQRFKKFTSIVHKKCAAWADKLHKLKLNEQKISLSEELEAICQDALLNVALGSQTQHLQVQIKALKQSWGCLNRSDDSVHSFNLSVMQQPYLDISTQFAQIATKILLQPGTGLGHALMADCAGDVPESDESITLHDVIDYLTTLLTIGQQSLRQTAHFLACCLSEHKEVQDRLAQEIEATTESLDTNLFEPVDIDRMEYLNSVVMETLRLMPRNRLRRRQSKGAMFLGTTRFARGEEIELDLQNLHGDKEKWTNPALFDPERFSSEVSQQHPYNFLPFGAGTHFCMGMRLAVMIIKSVLVHTVPRFEFLSANEIRLRRAHEQDRDSDDLIQL